MAKMFEMYVIAVCIRNLVLSNRIACSRLVLDVTFTILHMHEKEYLINCIYMHIYTDYMCRLVFIIIFHKYILLTICRCMSAIETLIGALSGKLNMNVLSEFVDPQYCSASHHDYPPAMTTNVALQVISHNCELYLCTSVEY